MQLLVCFSWEKPGIYIFRCTSHICQYATGWLLRFLQKHEWWWCTQQWGAFLLSNSQTSNFSFLIAVYTVCLHNPMPSFTIPSLHILYLIGSLPLSHLLVGRVKLREGFGLLIKDNGVDTFHTNGFLMGFSSSPGLCQVHWVSVVFVKGDVVADKPVEEWMREPKTGLCNVTVT